LEEPGDKRVTAASHCPQDPREKEKEPRSLQWRLGRVGETGLKESLRKKNGPTTRNGTEESSGSLEANYKHRTGDRRARERARISDGQASRCGAKVRINRRKGKVYRL